MFLSIRTTHRPATDLGWLLHKHPDRFQSFDLSFGRAHVFYPEAGEDAATAVLLLDVDPIGLVRGRRGAAFDQYVNDRPYVASSFLSVAISRVFGSALAGRSKERPELANAALPLEAELAAVPCRGGEALLRRLFEPLGYAVEVERHALDEVHPEWGASPYHRVRLTRTGTLRDLLEHLYVLVPVLDDEKHYYVGQDEVEKLLRHGESWLAAHPEKETITRRYLRHLKPLTRAALARLAGEADPDPDRTRERLDEEEERVEKTISLAARRREAVLEVLRASGAARVLDLGCGEGMLLRDLLRRTKIPEIVGVDVSHRALEVAARRLRLDTLPERKRKRIRLLHGSLTYRDGRLAGFDAAAIVEVVEHLDPPRLASFERAVFGEARPGTVALTTPNAEYNVMWPTLPAGNFRHGDHRFEWTRTEFQAWASRVAGEHGYRVRFQPIGPEAEGVGAPTQMGVFER